MLLLVFIIKILLATNLANISTLKQNKKKQNICVTSSEIFNCFFIIIMKILLKKIKLKNEQYVCLYLYFEYGGLFIYLYSQIINNY